MAYLRIKRLDNKRNISPVQKESSWVTSPSPTSLAARLTPEQKDAALIAELRYLEEQIAWKQNRE